MTSPNDKNEMHRTGAIVVALFGDRDDATDAITDLREAGFTDDDIGIAMQDNTGTVRTELDSTAAEGAAKGALGGGIVGGALGLLGSLLLPGVGPIVAGGVLGSVLAGAGIGAATGGIIGALVGMGVSREEAEHFDRGFREGRILVTVRADGRAMEARDILRDRQGDLGPSDQASESAGPDTAGTPPAGPAARERSRNRGPEWDDVVNENLGESWRGRERRMRRDLSYAGPERRMSAF